MKFGIVSGRRGKSTTCNDTVKENGHIGWTLRKANPSIRLAVSVNAREAVCLLLHEGDPRAEPPAHAIVESAKSIAIDVVLKVSRIETVGEIENFQTQLHTIVIKSSLQTDGPE